ncbi:MAG: crosslink repair DNA glycosylase YcaQ family protein, partial [Rhizobacter sp.]
HLLDGMHYRGLLRVARRENGTRIYEVATHPQGDDSPAGRTLRAAALIELIVRKYAPLPAASLTYLTRLLGYGAPHLKTQTQAAMRLAREHLASVQLDGTTWYWPADENPASARHAPDDGVRLLAPFDPVVWDRRRFELLWGWTYKFEAYTPAPQRKLGYYALPLLWGDRVIGWGNLSLAGGTLDASFGHATGRAPRDRLFRRELDDDMDRMRVFLGLE